MKRRAVVALLSGSILLLGVPGGHLGEGRASDVGQDDRAAIQALLDRRAAALLDGDERSFLRTVWPHADAFRERQRALLRNIDGLDLVSYEQEARWEELGDLLRPSDLETYGEVTSATLPLTRERYRLARFDALPVEQDQYLTFVKDGDEWFIADDDDLEGVGLFTQRNLWDFTPVRTDPSENFLLVMPKCDASCPASPDVILAAAESALRSVEQEWSPEWSGKVPLFAPESHEHLARILQAAYTVDNYVAFAFWTGEGESPAARIILNPRAFTGVSSAQAVSVLTHELVHVATLPSSGPFMPHFVDEGVAQYLQYGGSAGRSSGVSLGAGEELRVPADHEFFVGDQAEILRSYQKSLSVIGFLADEYGFDSVERFYKRLGRAGDGPGTTRFHLRRTLRRTFGLGLRSLERQWASSIGAL